MTKAQSTGENGSLSVSAEGISGAAEVPIGQHGPLLLSELSTHHVS